MSAQEGEILPSATSPDLPQKLREMGLDAPVVRTMVERIKDNLIRGEQTEFDF